ncbi:MAG: flavodoxin family protein [bacterium]|nr:flavodoxin family protein [bacterium]
MKVLTLLGSPRENGNTARLLDLLEREIISQGNEVERIDIAKLEIEPCSSCYVCFGRPEYGCACEDSANGIYDKMGAADALVWASPLYFWSFTAQMKALIDRSVSQVKDAGSPKHRSAFENKPAAMLCTCFAGRENNADLISTSFKRMLSYHKCLVGGELIVPDCTDELVFDDEVKENLAVIAGGLAALVK